MTFRFVWFTRPKDGKTGQPNRFLKFNHQKSYTKIDWIDHRFDKLKEEIRQNPTNPFLSVVYPSSFVFLIGRAIQLIQIGLCYQLQNQRK